MDAVRGKPGLLTRGCQSCAGAAPGGSPRRRGGGDALPCIGGDLSHVRTATTLGAAGPPDLTHRPSTGPQVQTIL